MANEVEIVIVSSQRGKGFQQADRDMDKLERKSGRLRGALGRVGEVAGGVLAAGLAQGLGNKAVGFFSDATTGASDLEEALSKSNTVFGDQAAAIEAFAASAAKNIGLSKGAALDAAGGFGNMFDQLGIGEDVSADMSQGIINLAADFASFNNLDTEEVLNAQSAAFRGEFDSLQKVLPLINAATVEQKALAQTGKSSAKELTQQEKAMATYALMVEGAGEAQGDFAKTSDGLANSNRIAEAEMANMRAEMGKKLLPVAKKITEIKLKLAKVLVDKIIPAFDKAIKFVTPLAKRFVEFFKALGGDGEEGSAVVRISEKLRDLKDFVVQEVVPRIVTAATKISQIWERIRPRVTRAVQKIGKIIEAAMELISITVRRVTEVIQFIWERWGEEITRVVEIVWNVISGVIMGALDVILGIIRTATAILKGDWSAAWEGVKQILSGAWTAIAAILVGVWNGIKVALGLAWDGIKAAVGAAVDLVVGRVETAWDTMVSGLQGLPGRVSSAVSGMWNGLWSGFRTVINNIIKAWNGLEFKIPSVTLFGRTIGGQTIGTPNLPLLGGGIGGPRGRSSGNIIRMASGGLGNGLRLVGEHGAELVDLGAGGRVVSNPDTERAMARTPVMAGGGGPGVNVTVNVAGSVLSERDLVAVVRDELVRGGLLDAFTSRAITAGL